MKVPRDARPLDLVVQAPVLPPEDVDALVLLTGARGTDIPERAGNDAVRLMDIDSVEGVAAAAAGTGYDVAVVPQDRALERVRLVAIDMDATLITIECLDEIAELRGVKPRIAEITARAMRGEIDFARSLRERVALLAGTPVAVLERVYDERLRLSTGAERMLAGFAAVGAKTLLVSGGFDFFTDRLRARLNLDYAISNRLAQRDGVLTGEIEAPIVDAEAKAAALLQRAHEAGGQGLTVAVGDGANDLPMLAAADISIGYRAKPLVRAAATHAIDHCGLDAVLNLFG